MRDYCYISTDFTPNVIEDGDLNIQLEANFVGSKKAKCNEKQIIEAKNGTNVKEYGQKLLESIEEFCPWEDNTTYTICFKTKSEHYSSLYVEALNTMANASGFKPCHFQVLSDRCYYQINLTDGSTSRVPSKWISFIESGELNSTKDDYMNETGCGIVYVTADMKERCYEKSNRTIKEYSMGSNVAICKCSEPSCDTPHTVSSAKLAKFRNAMVCNQGSSEAIISSPSFYCSVRLTMDTVNDKNVKVFNYSFVDQNIPYELDLNKCWDYQTLSDKLADSKVLEAEITSCFHNHENEIYECCCLASNSPCNTLQIIESYYKMVNQEAKDQENRLQFGCNFKINVSSEETCKSDPVQNDREMRCYGVFHIPTTRNRRKVKPILVKENCYWPHPQYHDQFSVFCSKAFFDISDLIENKCISVFINDFTSSSTITPLMKENKLDRTLIICCNTGVYPEKRDSILSRSINVL
uniref:Uncharacterized protein n=1 Tax=Panagrolaimus superbus TaxID=310955 RepID=A0A914Y6U4_9BILA